MPRTALPSLLAAALLAGSAGLTGCTGDDGGDKPAETPEQALAAAKRTLDETSGVHLTLASKNIASGTTALLSGEGVLTDAPAFDGSIVVQLAGLKPKVPVVAVGGKVYAQLPLTIGWQDIDPGDYGAPDPSALMSSDHGLSSMLTATTDVTKGDAVRGGAGNKEVLTSYSGTVPASSAAVIVPTVVGDVDATYEVTDDDELRRAVLTGDFYGTGSDQTYTVTLDDYGTQKDIQAP
jgi:lipoprotein LprG